MEIDSETRTILVYKANQATWNQIVVPNNHLPD